MKRPNETDIAKQFRIAGDDGVRLVEMFTARGHANVKATHGTTLEFTKDENLTPRGNCIVGVGATLAPADFSGETRALIRAGRRFVLAIRAGEVVDHVRGEGDEGLSLDDPEEMVFRKSDFVSGRTVLVRCDKAAKDLDARLRLAMKDPENVMNVALFVVDPPVADDYAGNENNGGNKDD